MATFTDRAERAWTLGFTLGDFPRFKAEGVDLNAILKSGEGMADLLFGDPERLGRFAWLLCEGQAAERGVTPEDFAGGFDGPALESLGEAVAEAVADFFPRSAVARAIKGTLRAKLTAMDETMIAALSEPPRKPAGGSPASPGSIPAP